MNIKANTELMKILNSLRIGIISANVRCESSSDSLRSKITESVLEIRNKIALDEIRNLNAIAAAREAYKKIGNDPNRYRPSADALLRRIVKGSELYKINNVVDTLNLISIQSGFSIGGYDAAKINGTIRLGIGKDTDSYSGIGRGSLNISNLLVLRDLTGAFGCPTSDSERTMITNSTKSILFIFFDFGYQNSLQEYILACIELLKTFSQAKEVHTDCIEFRE